MSGVLMLICSSERYPSLIIMYLILILAVLNFASSSEQRSEIHRERDNIKSNPIALNRKNTISTYNSTYIEKAENMLRVPVIRKYFEEQKSKRKIKKSQKRTVQKIIKKNRNKSKKVYLYRMTNQPSPPPRKENANVYIQDESQRTDDSPTTQSNQKRKPRKWNPKVARYPMPYQKLQRKEYKYKRSVVRDDLYILKDLDEIEFLSSDKDYDIVNAHVKNYW